MIVATHEDSADVAKSEREGFERALDSEVSARLFVCRSRWRQSFASYTTGLMSLV